MTSEVKPVPDGYPTVTPYLTIKNAAQAIEFYQRAFGATVAMRIDDPNGKIGHAEIRIGDSPVMLSDEYPEMDARGPLAIGATPVTIHLYVPDVDIMYARAIAAGAKQLRAVEDQFYGDRGGKLQDPFGHVWWISTRKENLTAEEVNRRAAAMFSGSGGS